MKICAACGFRDFNPEKKCPECEKPYKQNGSQFGATCYTAEHSGDQRPMLEELEKRQI